MYKIISRCLPALKALALMFACVCITQPSLGQSVKGGAGDYAPVYNIVKKLTVDGDASDWPIPATVFLDSRYGKAQMRFAADFHRFYALVEVEDTSPLKNGAGRAEEMFKGGDTVAFYFKTANGMEQRVAVSQINGQNEVYVYRNFMARGDEPSPYVFKSPVGETSFKYVAPAKGAQVAFRKREGKGYVLEVSFGWRNTLGVWGHRPAEFTMDAQVVFSDPGGTQNAGAAWLFTQEGPGLTVEDLPTEAKLYPDTWKPAQYVNEIVVRSDQPELAVGTPLGGVAVPVNLPREGRLSVMITDQNGWILRELVQAKKYAAGTHSIHWDGRDRYGEALPAGKYLWKALLFDGMQTKFMGSVGNSGTPPYRTSDGLGSMGGQHGSVKYVASSADGIYMANATQEGPPVMRKLDPETGKTLWQRSAGQYGRVDAVAANEDMACFINGSGKKCDLVKIDPATGGDLKMTTGSARVSLEEAIGDNHHESGVSGLVISEGKAWIAISHKNMLLSVDLSTGQKGKPISIPAPLGLVVNGRTKTLWLCSGSDVLEINPATGSKTVRISNLEAPRAVALDAQGNIYVSELGKSQQIKKFSADGKKLLATIGQRGGKSNQQIPYEWDAFRNVTGITIGPKGNIWMAESDALVRRFIKLDANGKWLEDFYGPVAYNAFGPDIDDLSTVYYNISDGAYIETKVDYEQYQKDPTSPSKAWHIVNIHDLGLAADGKSVNETMKKVADTGYGHVIAFKADNGHRYLFRISKPNRASSPPGAGLWIQRGQRWVPCAFITQGARGYTASWVDKNGDGLIQADEEYADLPVQGLSWIDRDLTVHGFEGKLSPSSVSSDGVPNYAEGTFTPYLAEGEKNYTGGWTFFSREQNETMYYISNYGPHRHLSFWDRATENRLIKIKDGKVNWVVGEHSPRPKFTELSTNSGIAGVLDGVILVQNIEPANYVAFTEDGFVLGDIMADAEGIHPPVGPNIINIESFTGLYVKDPKTSKNILYTVSSGDNRILEVTGPGATNRSSGVVQLDKVTPNKIGKLAVPYSTWYGNTFRGLGVDGEDTEWNPAVVSNSIIQDGQVVADFKFRRDAGNLNLFITIPDQEMQEGDGVQLVLTKNLRSNEKYTLSLTLAKAESAKNATEKWVAKIELMQNDKLRVSNEIKAAVMPRWQNLGYRIEAEIPLSLLPTLSEMRELSFRRQLPGTRNIGVIKETRLDLKQPVVIGLKVLGADRSGSFVAEAELDE